MTSIYNVRHSPIRTMAGAAVLLLAGPTFAQSTAEIDALRQQLEEQRALTRQLEQRINGIAESQKAAATAPAATDTGLTAGYKGGFFLKDAAGNNSLNINGLLQPRFLYFNTDNTSRLGATDQAANSFDIFLGRLYFSGTVMDPSIAYWFTLQGTTTGNGSGITLLDAKMSKTFSPYLTVEAGKYWSAYTYQYYLDIGQYLIPDLSAAEWAFSLGRQTGVRASGKAGPVAYSFSLSNSIPGSDVGNTRNLNRRLAVIANMNYDILAPYAWRETDPDPAGAKETQLSLWASAMYNPVEYTSVFQNDVAGDRTHGATASLNFRTGYLSFQGSAYYKKNESVDGRPSFSSRGWMEQAGFYLVPGKFELTQRVSQIRWGRGQIPFTGGTAGGQWYSGPTNFSYRRLTEYTVGFNYYLHGHNAKAQVAYSYLDGKGFGGEDFDAQRLLLQTQLAF